MQIYTSELKKNDDKSSKRVFMVNKKKYKYKKKSE